MNSQQELLDAINTISQKKERSFDTPATVLRVEGDTVWVHIDGGADETPCQKTINCEEGETVQVRISNGSAFLVGNASAPPTDDKTANVAHFVAEQADEKATDAEEKAVEAIRSVEAISQTVEGKVDSGDSNIEVLSSTMYQNANGVNIFNETLVAGDSYAHIDGDSFDIKQVTTAGTIDDANDKIIASFGERCVISRKEYDEWGGEYGSDFTFNSYGLNLRSAYSTFLLERVAELFADSLEFHQGGIPFVTVYGREKIYFGSTFTETEPWPEPDAKLSYFDGKLYVKDILRVGGEIQDVNGNKIAPTILKSSTISAATTSYTFTDDAITTDSSVEVFDEIDGFEYTTCTVSAGSCVITFDAQSTSHKIRLFVW